MTHLSSKLQGMMTSEYPADPQNFYYKWTTSGGKTNPNYKRYVCAECRRIRDQNRDGLQMHRLMSRKASLGENPSWLENDTTNHFCNPIPFATLLG
jgi:hypothetical protein